MATLELKLSPDLYERMRLEAERLGESIHELATNWLSERAQLPTPAPLDERERVRAVLREAGLLAELGPEMMRRAEQATMSLEEVRVALDRAGGQPLSEWIIEARGPKG